MFSTLRFRLWLTYLLVVGVVVLITGSALAVYLLQNPPADRRELVRLRLVAAMAEKRSQLLGIGPGATFDAQLQETVERIDANADARIAILNPKGELLADSKLGEAAALPEGAYFIRRIERMRPIFRDAENNQWLFTRTRLENGNLLIAAAPRPDRHVLGLLSDDDLVGPLLRSGLIAVALSLLLAFLIARWITAPLQNLAGAAHAVSQGESGRAVIEGPSEVQDVSRAFNMMADRVQASQQAQRDFIANVSHDLKTPLTSIQGFAQAILDGTAGNPQDTERAAQIIYAEAGKMHEMVNALLDLARLDSGVVAFEQEVLDLNRLIEEVVQNANLAAQRSEIELSFEPGLSASGEPLVVRGDGDRLGQVFANLLDNALKFSPPRSKISLGISVTDDSAEVRISDQGPGIPEEELERIFERFYQTDKARRRSDFHGFGLGLAIAREIVHAHGGVIYARNATSGRGSIFTVRLPLLAAGQMPQKLAR
jgi:signal transduction histidine kinase